VERGAAVGTVVGVIAVSDPDNLGRPGFQKHTCSLTPATLLRLPSGTLSIEVAQTIPSDGTTIDVTVTCSDSGLPSLSLTQKFAIAVVDRINPPKEIIVVSQSGDGEFVVEENKQDVTIGSIKLVNKLTQQAIPGVSIHNYTYIIHKYKCIKFRLVYVSHKVGLHMFW